MMETKIIEKKLEDLMGKMHKEISERYYKIDCIKTVLEMLKLLKSK